MSESDCYSASSARPTMNSEEITTRQFRLRLQQVRARIEAAAKRSDRGVDEITLVAVSKTHAAHVVRQAVDLGVTDLGENRVQEAEAKIADVGREAARWHLIGHLQTNKARRAVQLFDVVHSLDSIALARKLDLACQQENRKELPVLIQIDLGHEATKFGADEQQLSKLVESMKECERLRLIGMMTLPPFFDDPELTRPYFVKLRELRDRYQHEGVFGDRPGELSMGMTNDFEVAIEEGATMVRVGTAIFGERQK